MTGGNAPRRRGATFESALVDYLRHVGFRAAHRLRTPGGPQDRGDVGGIPRFTIEAKNQKSLDLAGWMRQAEAAADRNGHTRWAVVFKKRGTSDVAESYVLMPLHVFTDLLERD